MRSRIAAALTPTRSSTLSRSVWQECVVEREILITGIGGQGVQLCAQVLARAATLEHREVMYLGLYGGMMRGGNTDSTVVVADQAILAPPVVSRAWAAIAMHDDYWAPVEAKLRPGSL